MKKISAFLYGLFLLLATGSANAAIVTFSQAHTISEGYFAWSPSYRITQHTNNDGTPYSYPIPIYNHIYDGGAQKSQYYLTFNNIFGNDENQIPLGSTISNAHLNIYVSSYTPSNPGTISIHQIISDNFWGSSSQLGGSFKPSKGYPDSTLTINITNISNAMSFDVTDSINNWLQGEPNYGWVFLQRSQITQYSYQSYSNTSLTNPQLVVEYSNPVPVPGAFWLLGSGLIGLVGLRKRRSN